MGSPGVHSEVIFHVDIAFIAFFLLLRARLQLPCGILLVCCVREDRGTPEPVCVRL